MKSLTRRAFATTIGKFTAVLGIGTTVSMTTACPAWLQSIWTDLKDYAPTVLAAVATVISILTGAGVLSLPLSAIISGIVSLISKAITDLQVAVNNYQTAPSSQKSTLLGQVATALADAEANIQAFWSDLTIPDPQLAATIQNLLAVVVSTLQGYINSLGVTPSPTPAVMARASLSRTINVPAKRRSLSQFKSDFNAVLKPTSYNNHAL